MDFELNAIIVNSTNKRFKVYEKDLSEFGYSITHCDVKGSEIIAKAIMTDCDLLLLSEKDFENINELVEIVKYFQKNADKHIPVLFNEPGYPSVITDRLDNEHSFFHNIFPTGEKRSIIMELEKYENYRSMSCERLLFLLKKKVNYECGYIGINRTHEGFRWITEASLLILADENYKKNFSAGIYKVLEDKYNATYTQIEPAIRRCMNDFQNKMDTLIRLYYMDLSADKSKKYTTTNFIKKISDNFKLQYRQNYTEFTERADSDKRKAIKEHFMTKW